MADKNILITGGAGFIGFNLAKFLLDQNKEVQILDNLSRPGSIINIETLKRLYPDKFCFVQGDVRDFNLLTEITKKTEIIFHLAAQVAVTNSVADPRTDFEVNALGTFNVLEAARLSGNNPIILFTSTNKVYGGLEAVASIEKESRYEFVDYKEGIAESTPLDFHSPYGCSKGAADQYVRDYARIYGLPTIVFRMSCIYGTHQFGTEDQGWVGHFIISAALNRRIAIFGNGKQVRDILWIDDLIEAMWLAVNQIDRTSGEVFNIGGGPENTISIWLEFRQILKNLRGEVCPITSYETRPGDQPIYITNYSKFNKVTGWNPTIRKETGIEKLYSWVIANKSIFIT